MGHACLKTHNGPLLPRVKANIPLAALQGSTHPDSNFSVFLSAPLPLFTLLHPVTITALLFLRYSSQFLPQGLHVGCLLCPMYPTPNTCLAGFLMSLRAFLRVHLPETNFQVQDGAAPTWGAASANQNLDHCVFLFFFFSIYFY